jgi:stearoyl-CoA desaturase (delta-9 desaturase)
MMARAHQVTARTGRSRATRWFGLGTPFVLLHVGVLAIVLVGASRVALAVGVISYGARAFGITAFYHRCFAHRSFRVPRAVQLAGAVLGAAAAQRGPLWWVSHHRAHHRFTDRPGDPHSPVVDGFWYSHVLWIFDPDNAETDLARAEDLARFPELRFLDRFEYLVPATFALACFALGTVLGHAAPGLRTSGPQMLVWGFVVPTVALYHSTFAVNSLAHRFGRRRFETPDASRNNWLIAVLVLGEGWHNNHHRFPNSARQGLGRFELDPTWWGIRALAALGLASGVRRPPLWALEAGRAPSLEALSPEAGPGSAPLVGNRLDGAH